MRVPLSLSIIALMLSGCSQIGEQEPAVAETSKLVADAARPVDPTGEANSAGYAPTSASTELETSGITMPQAIGGRWREDDLGRDPNGQDCDQTSQSQRNFGKVLSINARGYSAFEDGGRIIEVHNRTDNMIDATFDTTYADKPTSARKDFALQSNGSLAVSNDDGDGRLDMREYLRCP